VLRRPGLRHVGVLFQGRKKLASEHQSVPQRLPQPRVDLALLRVEPGQGPMYDLLDVFRAELAEETPVVELGDEILFLDHVK